MTPPQKLYRWHPCAQFWSASAIIFSGRRRRHILPSSFLRHYLAYFPDRYSDKRVAVNPSYLDIISHAHSSGLLEHIPNGRMRAPRQRPLFVGWQLSIISYVAKAAEISTGTGSEPRLSICTLLEAATATANLHTALTASSNLALCSTRSDYYRAALLVCHVAGHAS